MSSPIATPLPKKTSSRFKRWLRIILSVLFLLTILTIIGVYLIGYSLAKEWVESPYGQETASKGVGKLIKVDGEFSPIHMDGWNLQIDSYSGPGWPGEAIGAMDLYNMRFELDPAAIFTGEYRIKGIQIDSGTIRLDKPDNALKRKMPPKPPKPWYAFLLPSRFVCGPMICPNTALEFTFQGQESRLHDAHVQADLIGKNLQYTATSGILDFSYLPEMRIEFLKMLVTREEIAIYDMRLIGLTPDDPARLSLKGRIGQHADKSINADVNIVSMPIEQILPEDLRPLIQGRATGKITYTRDTTGKKTVADGEIDLSGASLKDISVFKQLAILHGNPDLQDFTFDVLTVKFHLEDGVFIADLVAKSADKFSITGKIKYDLVTKFADLDVNFGDLPLKTWLPNEFKPRIAGVATASLKWRGHLNTIKESSGEVLLNLDGTNINNPVIMRRIMAKKGMKVPDEIYFKTAEFDFRYKEQTFTLDHAILDLPGILNAKISGQLTSPGNVLDAEVVWSGLAMKNWLPDEMSEQFSGDINGHAKFHVKEWKMSDGSYGGDVQLVHGKLRYTSAQLMMARFVGDRRLFEIPLDRASFTWSWSPAGFSVTNLDLRGDGDIGITGQIAVAADKKLSGTLLIGVRKTYLDSLSGLADNVFTRKEDGLYWAKVKLSGTSKHPEQDLSSRLMAELPSHPGAIFGLTGKAASWYLGNLIGVDEDWLPPGDKVSPEKSAKTSPK